MRSRAALVIGGSGATGEHVVDGLTQRGYRVTILHRGVHESPRLSGYRHIHADPHFAASLQPALEGERFEVVVAMYGRLAVLADTFAGRCERFVSVGGIPIYAGLLEPSSVRPSGMALLADEDSALVDPAAVADPRTAAFAEKLRAAEAAVLGHHRAGDYCATHLRYPMIYGPRNPRPHEWSVIKRASDGRTAILLPYGGLSIWSRAGARNAAHCLLLALESERAGGEVFNCADDDVYSLRQWLELIAAALGRELQYVGVPERLHWLVDHLLPGHGRVSAHAVVDTSKARERLGYRDVVSAADGLAETVAALRGTPPTQAQLELLGDGFRYDLEDAVLARLARIDDGLDRGEHASEPVHAYAHPHAPAAGPDHRGR